MDSNERESEGDATKISSLSKVIREAPALDLPEAADKTARAVLALVAVYQHRVYSHVQEFGQRFLRRRERKRYLFFNRS